jgi:DNA-binding NarL/FixJ family response regulator
MGGADAVERVTADCPDVKVIAFTMHEERGYVSRLLRAGAAGYVLNRTVSSELLPRYGRRVARGQLVKEHTQKRECRAPRRPFRPLTVERPARGPPVRRIRR